MMSLFDRMQKPGVHGMAYATVRSLGLGLSSATTVTPTFDASPAVMCEGPIVAFTVHSVSDSAKCGLPR